MKAYLADLAVLQPFRACQSVALQNFKMTQDLARPVDNAETAPTAFSTGRLRILPNSYLGMGWPRLSPYFGSHSLESDVATCMNTFYSNKPDLSHSDCTGSCRGWKPLATFQM